MDRKRPRRATASPTGSNNPPTKDGSYMLNIRNNGAGFKPERRKWPDAWLKSLDTEIVRVLAEDHPQSVRHVFYRLTDPTRPVYVAKAESGYRRVQHRLLKLRDSGRVPYRWIVDSTRVGYHVDTHAGPGEFLADVTGLYRRNLWSASDTHVEVWCESRSIGGVIERETRRLAVSLYPSGGFASRSFIWESAQEINRSPHEKAVALYVGDYDPAGVLIDKSIEEGLKSHLTKPLVLRRLAINQEQIAAYNLPAKPRKTTDTRSPNVKETVEAEAMPAGILRRMVRKAVEGYLPEGALQAARVAEEAERETLMQLAVGLA